MSSLDDVRTFLARAGVRTALSESELREIVSPGSSEDSVGSSTASGAASGLSGAAGDNDDLLSLPSEVLAELASPARGRVMSMTSPLAARQPRLGDAGGREPFAMDLRFEYESRIAELTEALNRASHERALSEVDASRRVREALSSGAAATDAVRSELAASRAECAAATARASILSARLESSRGDFENLVCSDAMAEELARGAPDTLSLRQTVLLRVHAAARPFREAAAAASDALAAAKSDAERARAEAATANARAEAAESRSGARYHDAAASASDSARVLELEAALAAATSALNEARAVASEALAAAAAAREGAATREAYAASLAELITRAVPTDDDRNASAAAAATAAAAAAARSAAEERRMNDLRDDRARALAEISSLKVRLAEITAESDRVARAAAASEAATAIEAAELRASDRAARTEAARACAEASEAKASLAQRRIELDSAADKIASLTAALSASEAAGAVRSAELSGALSAARDALARANAIEDGVDETVLAAGQAAATAAATRAFPSAPSSSTSDDPLAIPLSSHRRIAQAVALAKELFSTRAGLIEAESRADAAERAAAEAQAAAYESAAALAAVSGPSSVAAAAISSARAAAREARADAVVARTTAAAAYELASSSAARELATRAELDSLRERLAAGARDVPRDLAIESPRGAPTLRDNALPTGISIAPPPPLSSPTAQSSPPPAKVAPAVKVGVTRTVRPVGDSEHSTFSTIGTSPRGIFFANTDGDSDVPAGHPAVIPVDSGVFPGCETADATLALTAQQNNAGGSPGKVVVRPLVRLRDKTNVPLWYTHNVAAAQRT